VTYGPRPAPGHIDRDVAGDTRERRISGRRGDATWPVAGRGEAHGADLPHDPIPFLAVLVALLLDLRFELA
jgi:hypothetical protein